MATYISGVIYGLLVLLVVGAWRLRRRRVTLGPAAGAMMDKLMDDERRAAIEVVIEERAAYRDPEDADGDLPRLEAPTLRTDS